MDWPRPEWTERLCAAALCLLVSLFVVGPGESRAAGATALFVAMLLFFELAYPAIGHAGALLAAGIFAVCRSTSDVFVDPGSGLPYVPLLLLAVFFALQVIATADGSQTRHRLMLGLLALTLAALFYTSYTALLFFAIPLLVWRSSGRARPRWHLAGAAVTLALCGGLLLRNRMTSGFFFGFELPPSTRTLPANVADAIRTLYAQVEIGGAVLLTIVLGTVALVLVRGWRSGAAASAAGSGYAEALTHIAARSAMTYAVGLTLIATVQEMDLTDVRRFAPAVTLALLVLAVEAGRRWRASTLPLGGTAIFAVSLLLLGACAAQGLGLGIRETPTPTDDLAALVSGRADRLVEAKLELAERVLKGGRYADAVELIDAILQDSTAQRYRIAKALATAHAGLAEVDVSYAYTRECLRLDHAQAKMDITQIATPYFTDRSRYRSGIAYYERLKRDLPQAWWVWENIANLAGRLGDTELSKGHRARAEQLKKQSR